jgi:hypothetical protein
MNMTMVEFMSSFLSGVNLMGTLNYAFALRLVQASVSSEGRAFAAVKETAKAPRAQSTPRRKRALNFVL